MFKNINWSALKTNVIVFLVTAIVFTIVGWSLTLKYQDNVKQSAAELRTTIVKNVEVKAEVAPSK